MTLSFAPVTAQNKSSLLRPFGDESAAVITASGSMAGKQIYVSIGLFVNSYDPAPSPTLLPTFGYTVAFPGSNSTVLMNKQTHPNSYLHENIGITLQRTSATTMTITPYGLMRADIGYMGNNLPLDTLNGVNRNAFQNLSDFNNDTPSVYNSDKVLRIYIVVADGDNVEGYGYLEIDYTSRFAGLGLYNAVSEFTDFSYLILNSNVQGDGFSTNQDTVIRFFLTGDWNGCWIAIFEDQNNNNSSQYWVDLKLNMKYNSATAGAGSSVYTELPTAAIDSHGALTVISGSSKYMDITFAKEHFDPQKQYRIAFIPVKTNDYSNTFFTEAIPVADIYTPSTGTITDIIRNYSTEDIAFSKCCSGVAINERLLFETHMNKASYNQNIIDNDSFGTFDGNIAGYQTYVSDLAVPDGKEFDPLTATAVPYGVINDTEKNGSYVTLSMNPDWAGQLKYLTHVWIFNINDGVNITQDIIIYQQSFFVDDYATDQIEVTDVVDKDGNPVESFCGDDSGDITINFKVNVPGEYDAIFYLNGEHDPYLSFGDSISQSGVDTIIGSVAVDSEGVGSVTIDTKLLPYNIENCIEIIAISKAHTEGDCLSGVATLKLEQAGHGIIISYYDIDVTAVKVELIVRIKNKLGTTVNNYVYYDETGATTIIKSLSNGVLTADIDITVYADNLCILQGSTLLTITDGGSPDIDIVTLNPL